MATKTALGYPREFLMDPKWTPKTLLDSAVTRRRGRVECSSSNPSVLRRFGQPSPQRQSLHAAITESARQGRSLHTRTYFYLRKGRACLGRGPTDSNSSIPYFGFSVFSVIWGICFSLKANPNGMKTSDSDDSRSGGDVLGQSPERQIVRSCTARQARAPAGSGRIPRG
jgi:hypothetical protein